MSRAHKTQKALEMENSRMVLAPPPRGVLYKRPPCLSVQYSVIKPAPSCLRVLRDEEWEVRRDPLALRLTGDDPVPVGIADPVVMAELRFAMPAVAVGAVPALAKAGPVTATGRGSACPQTSQYPS